MRQTHVVIFSGPLAAEAGSPFARGVDGGDSIEGSGSGNDSVPLSSSVGKERVGRDGPVNCAAPPESELSSGRLTDDSCT